MRAHEDLDATRQRMHDRHVAHLLVTTPDGTLIGVLNAEDSSGWLRSAWSLTRGGHEPMPYRQWSGTAGMLRPGPAGLSGPGGCWCWIRRGA